MAKKDDTVFQIKGIRLSELPTRKGWERFVRFIKTFDVLFFRLLQMLDIYRPQKSIVGIPSLSTRSYTLLQAVVYNGTQEEVLGFKSRRLFHRILKGLPDLELFEKVKFQLSVSENATRTVEASTAGRGFIQLQLPWQLPSRPPRTSWLRLTPTGVQTPLGDIRLGDYEVHSAPVFFLGPEIKRIIISDIDDTIKDSHIAETTGLFKILSGLFRGHYYSYDPIEGMAELYQRLALKDTLVVYLTSTPFQLSPFLLKFLRSNQFPEGPVFPRWLGYRQFTHKYRTLLKILSQVEDQRVYLIGDSGEQDVQIYRRLFETEDYGGSIEKILIRHVAGSPIPVFKHDKEILFTEVAELEAHLK